jgi:hypothetical protein
LSHWGPTADHPTHCRLATQPLGIVDVFVACQPSKHRLPLQADPPMPDILSSACGGELTGYVGQVHRVVQPAISQKSGIRDDHRTAELAATSPIISNGQRAIYIGSVREERSG